MQQLAERSAELDGAPQPRHSSSFENMLKLRAHLASSEHSAVEDRNNRLLAESTKLENTTTTATTAAAASIDRDEVGLRHRAMYSRSKEHHQGAVARAKEAASYAQEVMAASKFLSDLQEWAYLGYYSALSVPVPGYGVEYAADLPVRAIPPMCAATAQHAILSVSGLLLSALSEDSTGHTQRSVCPVVRSLLTLENSLAAYCSTLQASQFVRISSMGRTQQIRYRARSESAIPDSIRILQSAVQQALGTVVRAYRDVLLLVVTQYDSQATEALFTRMQVTALEAKLLAMV
jgi:hypothetical protein